METTSSHSQLRVSFVIPAMNEATMIVGALDSIRQLKQADDVKVAEVIVVDSGSVDATAEIARAAGCRVIAAEPGNVSTSRNLGAAAASGNVLAFVDADCELPEDWLIQCGSELQQPDVVASSMQMAAPASDARWVERTWYELTHRNSASTGVEDAPWLATFNLAVHADRFQEAKGFDETLITCEDVDLGYRLNELGRLRFVREGGVVHHGESKTLAVFFRRESWRARGGWRLLFHHRSSLREVISCCIPFVVCLSLICGLAVSWWQPIAVVIGLLPLLLMVVRQRPPASMFPQAIILQAVYFVARCRGMLHPAGRVERMPAVRKPARETVVQSQASNVIMSFTEQDSNVD
jgi:glycosyltransferase involved in cell wall biosynthesis